MEIQLLENFRTSYWESSDRNIRLYQYKLTETEIGPDTDIEAVIRNSSPTIGYYEFSGIMDGTDLQMSLSPSISDYSVESYDNIIVFYEDLEVVDPETNKQMIGPAFIIKLDRDEHLRRATVNLLEISGFEPDCQITFQTSLDTDRLEGAGQGRYSNVLGMSEEDLTAYVTLESWRAYRQLNRSIDANTSNFLLDHLDTVRINEYGFKIY